ncbi:MAG: DinB family protein [Terriglobales bacterium]
MAKAAPVNFTLSESLLTAFDTNDRINQYMIENLPAEAWRAEPPEGKGRTVAAIVSHIHNVRVMWLKAAAKGSKIPEQLERSSVTPAQALKGLEQSRAALSAVLKSAMEGDGRVKGFKPDVAGFFGYLVAHDAHHRGQICMLARQVGHALPQKAMFGMWEWGSRGKA